MNCCQFCKNKNASQNYYLCKTCSNKILCESCFESHNKKDDMIKIKIDSTCKKHYNPYESYCPKCKESKCSYCSIDHDESHENDEFLLKKKLLKKNKIDGFKNTIRIITSEKNKIEQKIESVIKELEGKILFINNLKNKFIECLNMKLKFVDLVLNNYEKKIKDFDANYYIINNLEKQINFNLEKLNLNNNDSLDNKIESITNCINTNLNSHFDFIAKGTKVENKDSENLFGDDITKVDFKKLISYKYKAIGFLDFNKDLIALYASNSIFFISKKDFESKIKIAEYGLNEIEVCKKINDEKILVYTKNNIIIMDILGDSNYKISKKIDFSKEIYAFNSNLDILYFNYHYNNYNSYNQKITKNSIELAKYPNYNDILFNIYCKNVSVYDGGDSLQFINDNNFFRFNSEFLEHYVIKNNNCYLYKNLKIDLDIKNASIIDLNNMYFCLNDNKKFLLLDKKELLVVKTINILDDYNLGVIKISDKIVTNFYKKKEKLICETYDVLSNGIKWDLKEEKELLEGEASCCLQSKKYILFLNKVKKYNNQYGYYDYEENSTIFEINTSK